MTENRFFLQKAKRDTLPLMLGIAGASGTGKTFSALRLATGIQRRIGGDIALVDTESNRGLHYADRFDYMHLPFSPPFDPESYGSAVEVCAQAGATIVIVDSMSHEHEGVGGILEMHDQELARLSGGNPEKARKLQMAAWIRPKAARKRLLQTFLQLGCHLILLFRAKEHLTMRPGKDPVWTGWVPIGADSYAYETTWFATLEPGADGVPTWSPAGERQAILTKVPEQFRPLFSESHALCEQDGYQMAAWATGFRLEAARESLAASTDAGLDEWLSENRETFRTWHGPERQAIWSEFKRRKADSETRLSSPKTGPCGDSGIRFSEWVNYRDKWEGVWMLDEEVSGKVWVSDASIQKFLVDEKLAQEDEQKLQGLLAAAVLDAFGKTAAKTGGNDGT